MKNVFGIKSGFTLVELMIVLSILGLLVAGVAISLPRQGVNARDSRRKVDIEQIRAALEMYRTDTTNGNYPATLPELQPTYLNTVPVDPVSKALYPYAPTTSAGGACTTAGPSFCTTYTISTTLERTGLPYSQTPNSVAN